MSFATDSAAIANPGSDLLLLEVGRPSRFNRQTPRQSDPLARACYV